MGSGQRATITRSTLRVASAPSAAELACTPASRRRSLASLQAMPCSSSHSTRTGKRLPLTPRTIGSGNAPTIAGMLIVACQSR